MPVGLGTEGLEEVSAGVALGLGCCCSRSWSVFVGSGASRLLEGFWICGGPVPVLRGERCPALRLGAGLSRGLWLKGWGEDCQ